MQTDCSDKKKTIANQRGETHVKQQKMLAFLLAVIMLLVITLPAFAEESAELASDTEVVTETVEPSAPADATDPADNPTDSADDSTNSPTDPEDMDNSTADPSTSSDLTDNSIDMDEDVTLDDIESEKMEAGDITYVEWDESNLCLTFKYGQQPNSGKYYVIPNSWTAFGYRNGVPVYWRDVAGLCKKVIFTDDFCSAFHPMYLQYWFQDFSALETVENLNKLDTRNCQNTNYMFYRCYKLTSLDLSNFDTRSLTTALAMFSECRSLTTLDLSNWNTTKLTNTRELFYNCWSLHTVFVDPEKWSTNAYALCMFTGSGLIGGAGTIVTEASNIRYAHIDEVGNPGYFTDIADKPRMNMGLSNDTEVRKQFYVDEIVTTADNVVYAKLPKNSYPRFSTTSYPKLLDPPYAGYIFAGYFDSVGSGATAQRSATETTGYARFIPIETLDVYLQFRKVSRASTNPENKTDLRFITSVPNTDTLGFEGALVGFKLLDTANGKVISNHAFGTEYCYDEIIGTYYQEKDKDGKLFALTPDKFVPNVSAKVALQTVIGMPNTYFDNQKILSVQPYIITLDGTYSYAKMHTFQLKYTSDGSKKAVPVA